MNKKIFNSLSMTEENVQLTKCGRRFGCNNPAQELHVCPYSSEINGDDETLCDCCEDCEHECAMDI